MTKFYVEIQMNKGEEYIRASGPHGCVREAQLSALAALSAAKEVGFIPENIKMVPVEE